MSVEEATTTLARELSLSYGDKVEVQYINTRERGLRAYPLIARLAEMGYQFPIITVDGKPRLAGAVDLEQIRALLDEAPTQG